MAIGLSLNRTNVVCDGIEKILVNLSLNGETNSNYSLGRIFDGKLTLTPVIQKSTQGQNRTVAFDFLCTAKLMYTGITSLIKLLDLMSTDYLYIYIIANNGTQFGVDESFFVGFKWSFDSSKDVDGIRYVEVEFDRRLTLAEAGAFTTTNQTTAAYPTDFLYPLYSLSPADVIPAGISKYELRPTGVGSYEDLGVIRNAKLQCELITTKDSIGRSCGVGIKLHSEVEAIQGTVTELALANNIAGINVDHKLTLMDGGIFTSVNKQGVAWDLHLDKDTEDAAFIKIIGDGNIRNLVSDAWDNLWTAP